MIRKMFNSIVFNMDIFLNVLTFWEKFCCADIILKNLTSYHILLQTNHFVTMQMPTVTGNAFVPNQFSYFQALVSACKTKDPNKAIDVRMYGRSI